MVYIYAHLFHRNFFGMGKHLYAKVYWFSTDDLYYVELGGRTLKYKRLSTAFQHYYSYVNEAMFGGKTCG